MNNPLALLGNIDHDRLPFKFGLHGSHEPTRPRAKWYYKERMKDAVVEAAALLDFSDASFARYVEDQWNLMRERILCLLGRFATIRSRKRPTRTAVGDDVRKGYPPTTI